MKKVCVVTAARSEYSLLRWVIGGIQSDPDLQLQLVVTGGHLSPEQGLTYHCIEEDNYHIDEKLEMLLSSSTSKGIAKSMGICAIGISDAFDRLSPDIIVVLGDRYELLPICSTALIMRIPIAHIAGGEITSGAIDNEIRNAISMMANLHFPGTRLAQEQLISMNIPSKNIHVVGELGVESAYKIPLLTREILAEQLNLDLDKKWILFTFHPETKVDLEQNIEIFKFLLDELMMYDNIQVIASYSNADFGGNILNKILEDCKILYPKRLVVNKNIGELLYVNLLRTSFAMVGNSSSGIFETQLPKLPVLNIGNRQDGRTRTLNIFDCPLEKESIRASLKKILDDANKLEFGVIENLYGDGHTSGKIIKNLKEYIYNYE